MPEEEQDLLNHCRSCGAPIFWVKSVNGKNMPLDDKPEKLFVLKDEGDGTIAHMTACYKTHFVTCPNADEWRQDKSKRKV